MTKLTNGDDIFDGGSGDDVVNGLGGNDQINGNGGDDTLNGGSGNDQLFGGTGDDVLTGGSGDDTMTGGAGNDTFNGGSGDDTVIVNDDATSGMGAFSGLQLTLVSADGTDTFSGVEHIQFNNVTIDIANGNALAHLGADTADVNQDNPLSATAGTGVLANDIDINDTITLTGVSFGDTLGTLGTALAGNWGSLTLNADGSWSYSQNTALTDALGAGETATDTFTYIVDSGSETGLTETLAITIHGTNDPVSFTSAAATPSYNDTAGDDTFTNASGTLTVADLDTSDTHTFGVAIGDTLGQSDNSRIGFDTSITGTYGQLYINSATGAYEYVVNDALAEAAKTTVHDVFTFTVDDGNGSTDTQTFDVTINGVNDTPELAAIGGMTFTDTAADDTFAPASGQLVASDRDNDEISHRLVGSVADHSVTGFNRSLAGTYGTLYLNSKTGAYEYVANDAAIEGLKASDTDTFTFKVFDDTAFSAPQTLVVTVNGANDTPEISAGAANHDIVEAGGVANADPGTPSASLTVTMTDRDTADTPVIDDTAMLANGWLTADSGATYTYTNSYGTATLTTASGDVTFVVDNNAASTQALNVGDSAQINLTVYTSDGTAGNSVDFSFTIDGANDAAVVAGKLSGQAFEAGGVLNGTPGASARGAATDSDVDNTANRFIAVSSPTASDNGYGTFIIGARGHWVFTVDEDNSTVQALNVGDTVADSFTIQTIDGTTQTINVTIHGANDAAVVTGATSDSVLESGGALGPAGNPHAGGVLADTDVDNADNTFTADSGTSDLGYGSYTIDAAGNWTYTLDDGNAAVEALNDGDQVQDTFTVTTVDGTQQVVTVTVNGQNEYFEGTATDDTLAGTANGDTMTGFAGNDVYVVNNAADKAVEASGEGEDLVRASVSHTLEANVEDLTLTAHAAINGTGNELANLIVGNSARNTLDGGAGDDSLKGANGNDTLIGGDGDDVMNGGNGNDTVSYETASGAVSVSLATVSFQNTGGAGFDKILNVENLSGSIFGDTLTGNSARNVIYGCDGADTMTGGGGNDVFVYDSAAESTTSATDTITDLGNSDVIDLSAIGAFTIVGAFTHSAFELTLTFDSLNNRTVVQGDIDGDGVADLQIYLTGDHHDFTNFG